MELKLWQKISRLQYTLAGVYDSILVMKFTSHVLYKEINKPVGDRDHEVLGMG
jgi:hypothetical protein